MLLPVCLLTVSLFLHPVMQGDLTAIRSGWSQLDQQQSTVSLEVERTISRAGSKQLDSPPGQYLRFKRNGANFVLEIHENDSCRVYGANGLYFFKLVGKSLARAPVKLVSQTVSKGEDPRFAEDILGQHFAGVLSASSYVAKPYLHVIDELGTTPPQIEALPDGFMRISFTSLISPPGANAVKREWKLTCDPKVLFRVVLLETQQERIHCSSSTEYLDTSLAQAASASSSQFSLSNGVTTLTQSHRFLKFDIVDLPENQFRMSYYGLPEPFGLDPPPQPTPWFLYAGITAGMILVICVLMAWWQRRMQARAA